MVNKVILIGNLGGDPEMRETETGLAITSFSVATSETWTKNGQKETQTEWHKVVCFSKLAEICAKFLEKGSKVYVEGKIQTRKWETKEGEKRYTTEIIMREMKMLSSQGAGKDDASKAPF